MKDKFSEWLKKIQKIHPKADEEVLRFIYDFSVKQGYGEAEEVYCGVAVLYFQILREESSRAPFCVDREFLIKIASQAIRENEEQLKSIKKWGGQSSENGLWDEIQRYKKLFISKFGFSQRYF